MGISNSRTPRLAPKPYSAMASQFGRFFFPVRCADFERTSLNAMEERVLPPDVRIKIVCAQANAVEQEEEMLEADVSCGYKHLLRSSQLSNLFFCGVRLRFGNDSSVFVPVDACYCVALYLDSAR